MSRREDRESDSKRHRSRLDRESSPKRTRRDGKPATERPDKSRNSEILEPSDQKHRHRVPHSETSLIPDSKVKIGSVIKESDSKTNGHHEKGTTRSSDPSAVPRSRSFFQHDERNMAGQVSRSFARRDPTDRGWWKDSKNEQREAETSKTVTDNTQQQRNEKSNNRGGGVDEGNNNHNNNSWRHNDGFFETESDPKQPPARKRPSFREKKLPAPETANIDAPPPPAIKTPAGGREGRESRREERDRYNHPTRSAGPQRRDSWRSGGGTHSRSKGGGLRQQSGGVSRVEKWKHDLYNEANRSPTPKNEEDQIAKVEALLSS